MIWPNIQAEVYKDLGCVEWALGDAAAAMAHLREALRRAREFRDSGQIAKCLAVLASMVALGGDAVGAARLLAASEAILRAFDPDARSLDQALDPIANAMCAEGLAAVVAALPPADLERRWQEGAAMDPDAAVQAALGGGG